MAKKSENADAEVPADEAAETTSEDQAADEQAAEAPAAEAAPAAPAPQLQVDDSSVTSAYANFCRVTGSPEELIIDFGLNPQPVGVPKDPIHVKQRVVVNFYTAKRLLAALQMSVARHEAVFGVLETDVSKRVNPQQ